MIHIESLEELSRTHAALMESEPSFPALEESLQRKLQEKEESHS